MARYTYKFLDNPAVEVLDRWGSTGWKVVAVHKAKVLKNDTPVEVNRYVLMNEHLGTEYFKLPK